MATVLGTLTLDFESATLTQIVERPIEAPMLAALSEPLPLWELGLDMPALIAVWGPLEGLSWAVMVEPAVIPLPASVWLFSAALGVLWWRGKR